MSKETIRAFLEQMKAQHADRIDAIETYNTKLLPHQNARAQRTAEATGCAGFGSSYAHLPGTVGEVWTKFERQIESATDLHAALCEGAPRTPERLRGPAHTGRRSLEFGHLFWENSWQKFERLFLSGTEPTHPGHVAYDGVFELETARPAEGDYTLTLEATSTRTDWSASHEATFSVHAPAMPESPTTFLDLEAPGTFTAGEPADVTFAATNALGQPYQHSEIATTLIDPDGTVPVRGGGAASVGAAEGGPKGDRHWQDTGWRRRHRPSSAPRQDPPE
jgi:hypothetical protein